MFVGPGESDDEKGGGQDEGASGDDEAGEAAANLAEIDGELGGAGSGEQADRADEVEKFLARKPGAFADEALLHEGDVCGRATESNETEAKEFAGNLEEGAALGGRPGGWLRGRHVAA